MNVTKTKTGQSRIVLTKEQEREDLIQYYSDDTLRQLALKLQLYSGLRIGEVVNVSTNHIEQSDEGHYYLKIPEEHSKTDGRKTILSQDTAQQMQTVSNLTGEDQLFSCTKRTLQNWVREAGKGLADQTGKEEWKDLSSHDLRRSWGSKMVHILGISDTMEAGGWKDYKTFKNHYYSTSEEQTAKKISGTIYSPTQGDQE